jgi:hypothetical protein
VGGFVAGLFAGPAGRLTGGLAGALVYAPAYALGGGLALGLEARFEAPVDSESVASPCDLLSTSRRTVLLQLLLFGPVFGLVVGAVLWLLCTLLHESLWSHTFDWSLPNGIIVGLVSAFGVGIPAMISMTAWGQWVVLARIWLPLRGQLPWRVITFLEGARQRGALRHNGAVYQFRHDRLQAQLASDPTQPGP